MNRAIRAHRRAFFRLIPGACAAAWGQAPVVPVKPAPVKKESLQGAEQLMGLELSAAQETTILATAERNLANYESLRRIPVPLDIDPPAVFRPALTGMKVPVHSGNGFTPARASVPSFETVDDLAFCTVMQLAELVRTRKVSSRDLTAMYLQRLKEFGPKLHCVVTLTERLALEESSTTSIPTLKRIRRSHKRQRANAARFDDASHAR